LNEVLKKTILNSNEEDVASYLLDFSHSMKNFLQAFPLSSVAFLKSEFIFQNVIIYEIILSTFSEKLTETVKLIKSNILDIVDVILKESYLKFLISKDPKNFIKENFLENETEKLKIFEDLISFHSFKISDLFSHLIQDMPHMSQKLFGNGQGEYSNFVAKNGGVFLYDFNNKHELDKALQNWTSSGIIINQDETYIVKILSVIVSNSKVFDEKKEIVKSTHLKRLEEIFPEFSNTHLEKCLTYYKNDIEKTTASILENKLPLHLRVETKGLSFSSDVGVDLSSPLTSGLEFDFINNRHVSFHLGQS
jgi:hypothetical protein